MIGGGRGERGAAAGEALGRSAGASRQSWRTARGASGGTRDSRRERVTGAATAVVSAWRRIGGVGCSRQLPASRVGRVFGQPAGRWLGQELLPSIREQLDPAAAAWCPQADASGRQSRTSAGSEAAMQKSENARTAGRRIAGSVQQDVCPVSHPIRQQARPLWWCLCAPGCG